MCGRRLRWAMVLAVAALTADCGGTATTAGFGAATSSSASTGFDTEAPTSASHSAPPLVTTHPPTFGDLPPYVSSISPVTAERLGGSYRSNCPVAPDALRLLRLSFITFDGLSATGELVVAAQAADAFVAIFAELYRLRFPIRSMVTVDAFGADDDTSMAHDNTSAFNCRPITGGTGWSAHSYGLAVDINPRENPYVLGDTVLPPEGRDYLDRSTPGPGIILAGDAVVTLFEGQGFEWGGSWSRPVDYQHFERD